MIEAVFFDIDNTLLDFMKFKIETARAAAKAMVAKGLPEKVKGVYQRIFDIYEKYGMEYGQTFSRVIEQFDLELNSAERIKQAGIISYDQKKTKVLRPYPDVEETLAIIRSIVKIGIITDASRDKAWNRLVRCGLDEFFTPGNVVTKTDTGLEKPDPAPFRLGALKLGASLEKSMMVGDNPRRDIVGAKQLGMIAVLAGYGCTWKRGRIKPDFELNRFKDLPEIIRRCR